MNEKVFFRNFVVWLVLLICGMVSGCRTQPTITGSTVIQSAENIGKLKEQNRQLTELTDNLITGIESIENRIGNIESGIESAQTDAFGAEQYIDRAIRLFIEYKSRVDQFLNDYRNLQEQIKNSH
jgi:t-SNARE complex subunit (syntaxin)